ncbi:MAG: methylated-DNA--[protein]-cysteine S-methyltransferase [Planctomycetes bacterium]|nr:methylated-DNA--[protein]-cysteine S-methyltransferase [Planctomycetota bacterium]
MTLFTTLDSPIGPLTLTSDGEALTGIHMHPAKAEADWKRDDKAKPFATAKAQLAAYFRGTLKEFHLPLAPQGTPFQLRVWEELSRIPYGETCSYADIAKRVGNPKGCRAVGLANGRNPHAIVVPCHRVIGADGSLTGYGGGLERKKLLLALEARHAPPGLLASSAKRC